MVSVAEVVDGVVAALLVPCGCRCCHAWGSQSPQLCVLLLVVIHQVFQMCVLLPSDVASCCIVRVLLSDYRCLCHFVLVAGSGRVGGG